MERPAGFEPACTSFVAKAIHPLWHGRLNLLVRVDGFEPPTTRSQGEGASRLRYTRTNLDISKMVAAPGIEPDSLAFRTSAFT